MPVIVINDDTSLPGELAAAGNKLVVVDFSAEWYVSLFWMPFDV